MKLGDQFSGPAGKIAASNDNMTDSLLKAAKATNVFRDAQGRARDAAGKFLAGVGKGFTAAEKALDPWLAKINPKTPLEFMTAPAKLSGATKVFRGFINAIGNAFGPRAVSTVLRFGGAMETVIPIIQSVGPIVLKASGAGALLFAGASALALAGAGFVVQAQNFKQSTLTAFKLMLGSQQAGDAFFQDAIKFAAETPFETTQVIGAFKALTGGGFKPAEVKQVLSAVGDVAALQNFDPQVIERMILAINQIKGKGRLAAEELNQIVEASGGTVARVKIYEQLAKTLGKTKEEIIKLAETGKISADQGIAAILESIRTSISGGTLGGLMKELSTQIPGLLSTLKGRPEELIFAIPDKFLGSMGILRQGLEDFVGLLDPASEKGAKVAEAIGKMFDAFMTGLLGIDPAKNKEALTGGIEGLVNLANAATPALKGLGTTLRFIGGVSGFFLDMVGKVDKATGAFGGLFNIIRIGTIPLRALAAAFLGPLAIWDVVGPRIDELSGAMSSLGASFEFAIAPVRAFFAELQMAWQMATQTLGSQDIGTAIINGIINGITSGASSVVSAINSVTQGAIDAAKTTLGIASPSKVFEELGQFSMAGYAQGVANDTTVAPAVSGMLAAPAAAPGMGGGGSPSVTVNVYVDGGKNAQETGEIVARPVRREVLALFQELALSRGAAA